MSNRRVFVKNLISFIALANCPMSFTLAKQQTISGRFLFALKGSSFSTCCISNQDLTDIKKIHLPRKFETHSIENCGDDIFILVEKWKRHCCLINAQTLKIYGIIEIPSHVQFVGHAIYHNNHVFISVADYSDQKGAGKVFVYNLDTLAKVHEIETLGYESHQIFKIQSHAYVLNAGMSEIGDKVSDGSLSEINLDNFSLIRTTSYPNYNHYAHGQIIDKDRLLVIGGQTQKDSQKVDRYCRCSAAIYNIKTDSFLEFELLFDDYTHVSYLSADISPDKKYAVVTAPADHLVVQFDLSKGKITKKVKWYTPGSVSYSKDGKNIFLGVGDTGEIVILDNDLNEIKRKRFYSKLSAHSLFI